MRSYTPKDVIELEKIATQIRKDVVTMVYEAGSGHPGGSLSSSDIITALYFHIMNLDPQNPQWPDRDRFVLSKGHCCPAYYAALAHRGYFPLKALHTLRKYGSLLQGHPDMLLTPGVDMTTGSLGNGLSLGMGMALSARYQHRNYMTYVLMGDGEIQEGMIWEAAMAASTYHLDNLIGIVDCNGLQINGWVNDIIREEPLADKWKAFGWNVIEINGNKMDEVLSGIHEALTMKGAPTVILARTIKGKGVSFMEDNKDWHGKAPNEMEYKQAMAELDCMEEK